ncbi:MAG: DegT/DnrJ/EryC1/StrS family aminotransferase, partial [Lewinella sp.]|nr:DegT/DnrJ/EryC1/StrS family aminotransferase [Lewinella sp.]
WPGTVRASNGGPVDVLRALGVKPGDYVILPNLSPIYWAEAVKAVGADCILMDVHAQNWQVDLDLLEMFLMNYSMLNERDELILKKDSRVVRALIVPHLLGGLCDLERLEFITRRFNLAWGEDITQALGCNWNGRPAGSFGQLGFCTFEYNPLLPFGAPLLFAVDGNFPEKSVEEKPGVQAQLVNHLGRQFVPKIQWILERFRSSAQRLREDQGRNWMQLAEACESNGLAMAFLAEEENTISGSWDRLPLPLYRQTPFDKSLYIRQEDWSEKIQERANVFDFSRQS